eukprot:Lankesteria_metandrocarpae@DN8409_c0_g1_i1.p1
MVVLYQAAVNARASRDTTTDTNGTVSTECLASADHFLPTLIWVLIRTKPRHLHSTVEYISTFRSPALLVSQDLYFFTHFCCAVLFIRNIGPKHLRIAEDEYWRLWRLAESNFVVQPPPGDHLKLEYWDKTDEVAVCNGVNDDRANTTTAKKDEQRGHQQHHHSSLRAHASASEPSLVKTSPCGSFEERSKSIYHHIPTSSTAVSMDNNANMAYISFLKALKQPECNPILLELNRYIESVAAGDLQLLVASLQDLDVVMRCSADILVRVCDFGTMNLSKTDVREGVEKYATTKLYSKIFGMHPLDAEADRQLEAQIHEFRSLVEVEVLLESIPFQSCDVAKSFCRRLHEQSRALLSIERQKCPRDKLSWLYKYCVSIMSMLDAAVPSQGDDYNSPSAPLSKESTPRHVGSAKHPAANQGISTNSDGPDGGAPGRWTSALSSSIGFPRAATATGVSLINRSKTTVSRSSDEASTDGSGANWMSMAFLSRWTAGIMGKPKYSTTDEAVNDTAAVATTAQESPSATATIVGTELLNCNAADATNTDNCSTTSDNCSTTSDNCSTTS